jgi:hypothetical protein
VNEQWRYVPDFAEVQLEPDHEPIAEVETPGNGAEAPDELTHARGFLMAAAPDLLAACEAAFAYLDAREGGGPQAHAACEQLSAALAKARGEPVQ